METPGNILPERLQKRDRELQLERQRKRQDKDQENSNRKAVEFFQEQFKIKKTDIDNRMNELASSVTDDLTISNTLSEVSKDIHSLQKYFSASTMFLCMHDIRKAQEGIQALQTRLQELEEKLLPKKRFGFKARKAAKKEIVHSRIVDEIDAGEERIKLLTENDCGIKNKTDETILLRSNSITGKDVVLSNLSGCTVKLMGSPSTLHMTDISNCTIFTGPVATSIFMEDCYQSVFVLPCQQLRIHRSRNCDFYLHVTSRVIIEDSNCIQVAPYNWTYVEIEQDFQAVGWDMTKNHWNCVDDFNWLASDTPSPNWCTIDESKRVSNWN